MTFARVTAPRGMVDFIDQASRAIVALAIGALFHLWPRRPRGGRDPAGYARAMLATIILQAGMIAWMGVRRG
ncbi:MAG: hypothetical protein H7345_10825 [Rubritepida sp.]|nr:hypothetical protein [Rubritepida sp.]